MVIIRVNAHLQAVELENVTKTIKGQAAKDGIIVLPPWCELLNEVPADEDVKVVQLPHAERLTELEQQLARAMFYISAQKDCATCRHSERDPLACTMANGVCAICSESGCGCRTCRDGSQWEWLGAHG